MEFITNLWNKNKILFILGMPIVLIILIAKVVMFFNLAGAKTDVANADKTNEKAKAEQDAINAKANALREQANNLNNTTTDDVELNWHVKK